MHNVIVKWVVIGGLDLVTGGLLTFFLLCFHKYLHVLLTPPRFVSAMQLDSQAPASPAGAEQAEMKQTAVANLQGEQ